jgi:ribosome production factor 1
VPRTIENTREVDETVCKPDDEEVFIFFNLIILT